MRFKSVVLKNYAFSILLIISIAIGSLLGLIFKERSSFFKPFGDIFLNLLFTIVVPMVFFSIASAVKRAKSLVVRIAAPKRSHSGRSLSSISA